MDKINFFDHYHLITILIDQPIKIDQGNWRHIYILRFSNANRVVFIQKPMFLCQAQSPPPPSGVLHLPRCFENESSICPPPVENTPCPYDKMEALKIAIFRVCSSPYQCITLCVQVCECVVVSGNLQNAEPCRPYRTGWRPPCWEVGNCSPPPPLAHRGLWL